MAQPSPAGGGPSAGFDSASGMPPSPTTLAALSGAWPAAWADPGRRYPAGREARHVLDTARAAVARAWGADPGTVLFAPDRATAVWWALTGHRGTAPRLVVGATSAADVLRTADVLAGWGAPTTVVPVDPDGRLVEADLVAALAAAGPATVVVEQANLEIGTVADLARIRALSAGHTLVVDQQAVAGREPLRPEWDVAFADARMWGGPPGVTVVAVRDPARFAPAAAPTDGHCGVEATYPPVPLIAAAGLALENPDPGWAALAEVSAHLRATVCARITDCAVVGDPGLGYLTMFTLLYVAADELVDALGRRGWAVASGASCTSDTRRPHHVLVAVGAATHGSLRVSLAPGATRADADRFCDDLVAVVAAGRAAAGAGDL